MPNWKILLPTFFILLFLTRYYEFFYLYEPLKSVAVQNEYVPTFGSFALYNFFPKTLLYSSKFLLIACVVYGAIFLEGRTNKTNMVSLKDVFLLVVLAELIFFISDLTKIINFTFVNPAYTKEDFQTYYPLSLFSLLQIDRTSDFAYMFQTLNLFEAGYICALIYGLNQLQFRDIKKAATVAFLSYGGLLLIWILMVIYFGL
jgi:hypothetical protein